MPRLSKIGAAALAAFGWTSGSSVTASYLVVAGGGGGGLGSNSGGGGGAGGYRTGTASLNPTLSYSVTVGAGGAGATATTANGSNGSDSVFNAVTSTGGGGGGSAALAGSTGGSGGGGGTQGNSTTYAGGAGNTPSTSPSQGNNGGSGQHVPGSYEGAGGGGGAGAVGGNSSGATAGSGGAGTASSISGTSVTYAGGAGGGGGTPGTGGSGGGGNGAKTAAATSGTANLGGGGGGGYASFSGASGGSGVVIISYPGAQQFGGGNVTSVGGNTIHTFTTSGSLSPLSSLTAQYLIVAGGGGGGSRFAGGGGAGGMLTGTGLTLDTNSNYVVTVGAGGAGGATSGGSGTSGAGDGTSGSNSLFSMVSTTAIGGGGGGAGDSRNGLTGGSGGGGAGRFSTTGGSATSGQGSAGGNSAGTLIAGTDAYRGSGGGGAGGAGATSTSSSPYGGQGGVGLTSSISGTSTYYAGGGGGGTGSGVGGEGQQTPAPGGSGGGGAGANTVTLTGTAGTANTGGGGGGGAFNGSNQTGGAGGSGIVIIAYPGSTQQMAGGTVTISGGNVIHTFTSSGYLTPIKYVSRSLRFRNSVNAYLSRTPKVAGNQQKWTFSTWIKRTDFVGTSNTCQLFGAFNSNSDSLTIYFSSSNITIGSYAGGVGFSTTAVFRDPSAWYHIVVSLDTTQATAANRLILYVNGVQQTALTGVSYPSQNATFTINGTAQHGLMALGNASPPYYSDGYLAEVNFVDGQQLTPSSFGTFNSYGVWQPITYGGSYGTNGFYLPFNSGTSGYVGNFSGSGQYLTVSSTAGLNFGSGAFTVEAYICLSNVSATKGVIFGVGNNSFGLRIGQGYSGNVNGLNIVRSGIADLEYCAYTFIVGVVYHIAVVRSGTTIYFFVNGVQQTTQGSGGGSYSYATPSTAYIGANNDTNEKFAGTISNLRVLNGTALYTSNFTPPTSTLTAITNTSLLTLQNATFVDNSTNAFSITNNGSTTIGQSYPFSYAMFNDQSPAGNNWTANNLSLLNGTTLDSMLDVPTLTSATAANYAVMNPLSNIGTGNLYTFSNGNLKTTVDVTTGGRGIVSTHGMTSGAGIKYYVEINVTAFGASNNSDYGILNTTTTVMTTGSFAEAGCIGAYLSNGYAISGTGKVMNNGSTLASGLATFVDGDTVQIAYDGTNIYFGRNGTWLNSAVPASGTGGFSVAAGTYAIAMGASANTTKTATANWNFGQQPFTYTPPSGFVALNTYNLSTPTIPNGATQMAATLYTGTGAALTVANTVNGTAMQPGFLWLKNRSLGTGGNHVIYDVVRGGPSNELYPNLTNAESTATGALTSLNSNGFTLSNAGDLVRYNSSGNNYVAWQWKANGTGVSNTSGSITSTVSANTTAGFSIATYTGNGTSGATVGHGLGVTPSVVIVKSRSATGSWPTYTSTVGNSATLLIDTTDPAGNYSGSGYPRNPNSTTFELYFTSTGGNSNANGTTYVAYCFAAVAGYSAFGGYTGNGSTDGPFIYTGFRPRFVLVKHTNDVDSWFIWDSSRNSYNAANLTLKPNASDAEESAYSIDALSNGFKLRTSDVRQNTSGGTYIYMAFAENPFKYSNAR
jgi:hypothetical protein